MGPLQQMLQMGRGYQMPQQPMMQQPLQPVNPLMQLPAVQQQAVPRVGPGSVPLPQFTPPAPGGGLAELLAQSRRPQPRQPVRPMMPEAPLGGSFGMMPGAR